MTSNQRRDSTESTMSLWEKLVEIKRDLPVDNDVSDESRPSDNDQDDDEIDDELPITVNKSEALWIPETYKKFGIIINRRINDTESERLVREYFSSQHLLPENHEERIRAWHFGLTVINVQLEKPQLIDITRLISPLSLPFWLILKSEIEQQQQSLFCFPSNTAPIKPIRYGYKSPSDLVTTTATSAINPVNRLSRHNSYGNPDTPVASHCSVSLRFGALIALDQFRYSPRHTWNNEPSWKWSLLLDNERNGGGHIEWLMENFEAKLKMQLLVINIDKMVIVHLLSDGFAMYICQKCNMSEFKANIQLNDVRVRGRSPSPWNHRYQRGGRTFSNRRPVSQPRALETLPVPHFQSRARIVYDKYKRIGIRQGSSFSTVQFSIRVDTRQGQQTEKTRAQARETLALLIDFFRSHNITVCYGMICDKPGPLPQTYTLMEMPNPIMYYSWKMLLSVGYRLEIQMDHEFLQNLIQLTNEKHNAEDLFYRICVYLSRVFTLQPFVNLIDELHHAETESKRKRADSAFGFISSLHSKVRGAEYVPSVTLTPTTIRIKPLKLCRTNRVLRAIKQFGKPLYHFALLDIREENGQPLQPYYFRDLHDLFQNYLVDGLILMGDDRSYRYLHHSQSQLRGRQFWFYHHNPNHPVNLPFDQAYQWMGDFRQEQNVAKYAARMALCFSTTIATIRVDAERVRQIPDIETENPHFVFTDGCGTMSTKLRNEIQKKYSPHYSFSAVQFRYAGAKGVVSVDPQMDTTAYDLCIRDSMAKFISKHQWFEVCKKSAPRPLYLNRQAIILLSYRGISDTVFLTLQQKNHFELIRALLRNEDAEQLLREKIPRWLLRDNLPIDFVREPFFRQLLVNACLSSTRELLRKTSIRVPHDTARNMIGIVDEYDILKHDQVFIQYTRMDTRHDQSNGIQDETVILDNRLVVITKNPCHHPGDMRTFTAISHPKFVHLKDVVVFSRQGPRPAPHEISGSDLDGDEYAVIWHEDLVPRQTLNATPYDYDLKIPSTTQTNKPVTRADVNSKILQMAECDCIGQLSNLHLAYADRFGVDSTVIPPGGIFSTVELAGMISQEVDSGKTGEHPLDEEKISQIRKVLNNEWPDFMEKSHVKVRRSPHIIGRLFRSSQRILPGWNRLLRHHRPLRHLQIRRRADPKETEKEENENDDQDITLKIDQSLRIPDQNNQAELVNLAQYLEFVYRQELLEILNVYELAHESDLWCRNANNGTSGELEDTAYTELEQLVKRTRSTFFHYWVMQCATGQCNEETAFEKLCASCSMQQRGLAVACYHTCYSGKNASEQASILSLPWLFATPLLATKWLNPLPPTPSLLTTAMQCALQKLIQGNSLALSGVKLTFHLPSDNCTRATASVDYTVCFFVEILHSCPEFKKYRSWPLVLSRFIRKTPSFQWLSYPSVESRQWQLIIGSQRDRLAIEIDPDYAACLVSLNGTVADDELMYAYFEQLLEICFKKGRRSNDRDFLKVSEHIILTLQRLTINDKNLE